MMSDEAKEGKAGKNDYRRTIDWKHGFAIGMGIPILVLPSIGYLASYVWAAAILIWGLSVCQAFVQDTAYGELATVFPEESGLPGYSQRVFDNESPSNFSFGKFVGGFSAWGYWFAWNPALAICAILIASCIQGLIPETSGINSLALSLICGGVVFGGLTLVSAKGIGNGARLGLLLAILSIVPISLLAIGPMVTGSFHLSNITGALWPAGWSWGIGGILTLFGLFAIAEWSTCFEGVVVFGPQYKNPGSDVPKALFGAGLVCLIFFVLVQASTTGTLGISGILAQPISPFVPIRPDDVRKHRWGHIDNHARSGLGALHPVLLSCIWKCDAGDGQERLPTWVLGEVELQGRTGPRTGPDSGVQYVPDMLGNTDRHPDRIGIRICVRKCDQLNGLLQSKDGPKDVKTSKAVQSA